MNVVVVAGTAKGAFVYRSDARRERWSIEGPLFKGWKVTAVAQGVAGDHLLATASDVYGPALHRSVDGLRTWQQVEAPPRYADGSARKLTQIWRFARSRQRLIAGVDEAALFTSDDAGDTWQLVEALAQHPTRDSWFPGNGGLCAHAILTDQEHPERWWCGISAVGVFRTDDGGRSWQPKNVGVPVIIEDKVHKDIGYCVHALVQDPGDPRTIYRQDHKGMFRTRDGGDHWERIERGLPSGFGFPLAMHANSRTLFAVPLESDEYRIPVDGKFRVYASRDGGDSWQASRAGLPDHAFMGVLRSAMDVDQLDPGGVYVGSTAGSMHCSIDGGDTWSALPGMLPRVLTVAVFTLV
ncbi:MAG: exo-alpha-sialidase [Planctomycetota bacterium]